MASDAELLAEINAWLDFYPEARDIGLKRNIDPLKLVRTALAEWEQNYCDPQEQPTENFTVVDAGDLSYSDARNLYRRLSRWFAQHGMHRLTRADRRRHGKEGAKKRWGKEEQPAADQK